MGIATSALIVQGCILMRKCHENTCPVGIATQNGELRKNSQEMPIILVNYFTFLATETREIMAFFKALEQLMKMVGQYQCLNKRRFKILEKLKPLI